MHKLDDKVNIQVYQICLDKYIVFITLAIQSLNKPEGGLWYSAVIKRIRTSFI